MANHHPPTIVTFVSSIEEVDLAINAGATHLILEDPSFSIRSIPRQSHPIAPLEDMASHARNHPGVLLSVMMDAMTHSADFPALGDFVERIEAAKIPRVRIQDPGLLVWFQENAPNLQLELSTETGNLNLLSHQTYAHWCIRQVFGNELPHTDIQITLDALPSREFEIQVHGRILLQYSRRRFLRDHALTQGKSLTEPTLRSAEDLEFPGRIYTFLDNAHGHFMYLQFDRGLILVLDRLKALPLTAWLVDVRGEPMDVQAAVLTAYRRAANASLETEEIAQLTAALTAMSERPFKPGFFIMNKTDQVRENTVLRQSKKVVGVIEEVSSGKSIMIRLLGLLTVGESIEVVTPEGRSIPTTITAIQSIWGESLLIASPLSFVRLPWFKGVTPHSLLLRLEK